MLGASHGYISRMVAWTGVGAILVNAQHVAAAAAADTSQCGGWFNASDKATLVSLLIAGLTLAVNEMRGRALTKKVSAASIPPPPSGPGDHA